MRVMGPPDLPLQPCVSTPVTTSNNIPCLLQTAISTYLGLLRRGRRSREGTGEKELFQPRGGTEGAEPKRKALGGKAFCSYYWGQKSLL